MLSRESPSYFYYTLRNNLWVLAKCAPLSQLPARVALALLESLISFVGHWAIARRDAARLKAILRGLAEGLTGFGRFLVGAARFGGHEDPRVDLDLLFSASLRRALAPSEAVDKSGAGGQSRCWKNSWYRCWLSCLSAQKYDFGDIVHTSIKELWNSNKC